MRFLLAFLPIFLYSGEYFAKVEPFEKYTISSKVSGLVSYTNEALISKKANNQIIIKIDDEVAKINYEVAKATYEIKKDFFEKTKRISTKSKSQIDNEKISFLKAKEAYIRAKDDLSHRQIKAENLYIEDILVKRGNYVNPGTILIKAYDISQAKITIYVTKEDIQGIQNKTILVNGKEGFKLFRYFVITDKVQVSSYKVELLGAAPRQFSTIAKVQIK